MVFQKLQVSQTFSRISQVSPPRFLRGSVCLAASFFSQRHFKVSIRSRNFKVSVSQRKMLVSPSRIYHSPPLNLYMEMFELTSKIQQPHPITNLEYAGSVMQTTHSIPRISKILVAALTTSQQPVHSQSTETEQYRLCRFISLKRT